MRVFVTKWFARFVRKERIDKVSLLEAVQRIAQGSIDANLGGHLFKQRIARSGGGKSGGYRTIIAFRAGARGVFLYGFAKNERENIGVTELDNLKELARILLRMSEVEVETTLAKRELMELLDEQGQS